MLFYEDHGAPITGLLPMKANYEYGTDNLMDLSHIEFVHRGTFAGRGVIFAGKHSLREEGTRLHSDWWMPDVAAPGHTYGTYDPQMRCDHWLNMRWDPPASMYLEIGACPHGGEPEKGLSVHQAHILTPVNGKWCLSLSHWFAGRTRGSRLT